MYINPKNVQSVLTLGCLTNGTYAITQPCTWLVINTEFCLSVCFVVLRPKSRAMVMAGRSVQLTTHFPGQAWTSGKPVLHAHAFQFNWQKSGFLNDSVEGRRVNIEIISWSISTNVWDRVEVFAMINIRQPETEYLEQAHTLSIYIPNRMI